MSGWFVRRKRADAGGGVGGFDAGHRWAGEAALRQRLLAAHARAAAADYGGAALKPVLATPWTPDNLQVAGRSLRQSRAARTANQDYGAVFPGSFGPILAAPTNFWRLEESSGTRVDSAGTSDLNLNSGAPGGTTGLIGGALNLTLNSQYVGIADNAELSLHGGPWTIGFWIFAVSPTTFGSILGKFGSTFEYKVDFPTGDAKPRFLISNDGSSFGTATSTVAVAASTWTPIRIWNDTLGNQIGIQVGTGTKTTTAWSTGTFDGAEQFRLGKTTGDVSGFVCTLDAVAVWKGTFLSDADWSAFINGGVGTEFYSGVWH